MKPIGISKDPFKIDLPVAALKDAQNHASMNVAQKVTP